MITCRPDWQPAFTEKKDIPCQTPWKMHNLVHFFQLYILFPYTQNSQTASTYWLPSLPLFLVSLYYMSFSTEWAGLIPPWIFKMLFSTSWCFVPFSKLPISLGNLLQIDFTSWWLSLTPCSKLNHSSNELSHSLLENAKDSLITS